MLAMQYQEIVLNGFSGDIVSTLSDGNKIMQPFKWAIEDGQLKLDYTEDISDMEVIGTTDEYTDEQIEVMNECVIDKSELEHQIISSYEYHEAMEEYKASRDMDSYYGVSPRDFF